MLEEITIKNFVLIEEVSLKFDAGMTVLSGETGAGKSIIIDAMGLLLGNRASAQAIRHGAKSSEIEGLFFVDQPSERLTQILDENGLTSADGLILRREILANGRTVCRINGQLVTLAVLKEIGGFLIDIHGQHDAQDLMNEKEHLNLLDAFGDKDFKTLKANYLAAFDHFREARKRLTELKTNQSQAAERIQSLTFQRDEILDAAIDLTSDAHLTERRDFLDQVKDIAESLERVKLRLDSDDDGLSNGAINLTEDAMAEIAGLTSLDSRLTELSNNLSEALDKLQTASDMAEDLLDDTEFDSGEYQALESRIFLLSSLKRKYGPDLTDVIAHGARVQEELSYLTGEEADETALERDLKSAQEALVTLAEQLSAERHKLSKALESAVQQELAELYMDKAKFRVKFDDNGKFTRNGRELVTFEIETNPGEGFKSLSKTASGGELSRIMLAIKSTFSRQAGRTSIVFDEVDTGVSGRVAQAIAEKIYNLSKHSQVLAISHLPQVVAIADTQLYIEKESTEDVTTSTVKRLTPDERVEVVAQMIAGAKVTKEAIKQAESLLKH